MTEGIIQKVMQPIIEFLWLEYEEDKQEDPESPYTKYSEIRFNAIIQCQQKLIEALRNKGWNTFSLEELIGDTKE